ncbi:hypothetical protein [Neorhizobium sp. T6_25]|uniref:hypothetical protein n=1 Tax=Neorhizobium sp. T6_25 TaxID=2093833 RepID=UPI000CF9E0BE|nr:hypothetical protein [Neorhizobium sp. T6_25]
MGNRISHAIVVGVKMLCAVVAFFAMVFTVYAVGPAMETRFFPVVGKLDILTIEPTADGQTQIRAAFRKIRDCEYVGIAWFSGDRPGDFDRVSVQLMREPNDTSSPNRPVGYQRAGPWIIGLPVSEVRNRSFAQLTHRCHPFWTTTTDFYP